MARQDLQPTLKDLPSAGLELATQRAEGELATTVLIPPPTTVFTLGGRIGPEN